MFDAVLAMKHSGCGLPLNRRKANAPVVEETEAGQTMPKVKVRFRKYKNIPFAIEQFTGVQYRCRVCNRIFLDKKELEAHLHWEAEQENEAKISEKAPVPGQNITGRFLYTLDIHDHIRGEYLHTKNDVSFDSYVSKKDKPHKKGE